MLNVGRFLVTDCILSMSRGPHAAAPPKTRSRCQVTILLNIIFLITSALAVTAPLAGAGTTIEVGTLVTALTFGTVGFVRALTASNHMFHSGEEPAAPAAGPWGVEPPGRQGTHG